MRPGQLEPNEFEIAIVRQLMRQEPSIAGHVQRLQVLSRTYTGVGCFTNFRCDAAAAAPAKRQVSLNVLIRMPGVPNGLGAILFCRGSQPECLEVYAFGDDKWDGVYDGFSIEPSA